MRVAIIGSTSLAVTNLEEYLPVDVTEIISGAARGIDTSASRYAKAHGIKLTEYLPEYELYGRAAPIRRNVTIINHADLVLAFWDGVSRGTAFVIEECKKREIPCKVYIQKQGL